MIELDTVINDANRIAPRPAYRADKQLAFPLVEALTAEVNREFSGIDEVLFPTSFELTVTVNANHGAGFVSFWTSTSDNNFAGVYLVTLFAEVTGTTIPGGSAVLSNLSARVTSNGTPSTLTSVVLDLSAEAAAYQFVNTQIDNGTAVEYEYVIAGYTSGTATLHMRINLIRVA